MKSALKTFMNDESGATAVEYALIVGLVAGAVVLALTTFRTQLQALYTRLGTYLATIEFK